MPTDRESLEPTSTLRKTEVNPKLGNEAGRPAPSRIYAVMRLQRLAGNASVAQLLEDDSEDSLVKNVVESSGGSQLDEATRESMESKMGFDFSDVRIHTDSKASQSAKSLNAQAYTVGTNIVFGNGKYQPGTGAGDRMIAHELTHVVQQKVGPVDGTPVGGGLSVSSPDDRFERAADETAEQVMNLSDEELEEE